MNLGRGGQALTAREIFDLIQDDLEQVEKKITVESVASVDAVTAIGQYLQSAGAAMPSEQHLSRVEAIVLSMTIQERHHPELIKGSRRKRIAAGSGTTIASMRLRSCS